jgi:Zn-dependent M32 family carboxypeptidase
MASPVVSFLTNTQTVNWENTNMVKAIVGSIVNEDMNDQERVDAAYNYIVDSFSDDYDKMNTLDSNYVPNIDNFLMDAYHAWREVYVAGNWIVVDTRTDSILNNSGMFTMLV